MYKSIFDPKNKVTIVKENSAYPRQNDCYHVKINSANPVAEYDIHYLSKAEYELSLLIRNFSKILRKDELTKLIDAIENYGDYRYTEASDNAAMNDAGESL